MFRFWALQKKHDDLNKTFIILNAETTSQFSSAIAGDKGREKILDIIVKVEKTCNVPKKETESYKAYVMHGIIFTAIVSVIVKPIGRNVD